MSLGDPSQWERPPTSAKSPGWSAVDHKLGSEPHQAQPRSAEPPKQSIHSWVKISVYFACHCGLGIVCYAALLWQEITDTFLSTHMLFPSPLSSVEEHSNGRLSNYNNTSNKNCLGPLLCARQCAKSFLFFFLNLRIESLKTCQVRYGGWFLGWFPMVSASWYLWPCQ